MSGALGIYIHIPFCRQKCSYCDFHSVGLDRPLMDEYLAALVKEIFLTGETTRGVKVSSVFFGGGTPSLLTTRQVVKVLGAVFKTFDVADDAEITFEANPESLTPSKLRGYMGAGVNRLSIGVQSLSGERLNTLGRVHTAAQGRHAVDAAIGAGFTNISIDLMFSIPGQSVGEWEAELGEVCRWGLKHISCYQLTAEPGTPFGRKVVRGSIHMPEIGLELFDTAERILAGGGFGHYEISNYALPGFECVHNLGYWRRYDYLGFGASAHSLMAGKRWANVKAIGAYIKRTGEAGRAAYRSEKITAQTAQRELLMLGLRLREGVELKKTGLTEKINELTVQGLLEITGTHLRATGRGWRLLDSVLAAIVP